MNLFVCRSALAVCALSTGLAFAVSPQRTFVASTGNDVNPCTLTAPCRGFQAAINSVAAGGEVVALDSAGYGAMEIHKSVSVIVPPGVHAGLSPVTGIPLPGFPGQSTVVLIDIQATDTVVLRGLNVNHQGSVTGGIHWLSANSGIVHVENTTINGFLYAGLFMSAPGGKMFVKDSIFRDNGYGIYIRGNTGFSYFNADHVRIENSTISGLTTDGTVAATLRDSVVTGNLVGIERLNTSTDGGKVNLDRCAVTYNDIAFKLEATPTLAANIWVAASTIADNNTDVDRTGANTFMVSLGNNSVAIAIFNVTFPLR